MVTSLAVGQTGDLVGSVTLMLFVAVVVVTMFAALITGATRDEVSEFYLGNRELSPLRNGLAMCGSHISTVTLLGSTGVVALSGYDGLLYLAGTAVSWLLILLLFAEPLHNSGGYTLGDTLARRLPDQHRPVRIALAVCTLAVTVPYLVAQLNGSQALLEQVVGVPDTAIRTTCAIVVGALVTLFVAVGGMPGATFIQVLKAVILVGGIAATAIMVMIHYHWNPDALLRGADARSGSAEGLLHPGTRFGDSAVARLDLVSIQIAVVLGPAALPHVLMRLLAPRRSRVVHRSVLWAIGLVSFVCLAAGVLGLGAAGIVGKQDIMGVNTSGNASVLLLAQSVGGDGLNTVLSCLVFITLMAVSAGLTLTAASSLAHDVYAEVIRRGRATERQELNVARSAAVVIGVLGVVLSLAAWELNTAAMGFTACAIAASTILPTMVYTLFWRRFSAGGALLSLYGGLTCSLVLFAFSPVVSSVPDSFFPSLHFAWFPLHSAALVTVPAGFLLGWLGTVLRPAKSTEAYEEFEYRALVGVE